MREEGALADDGTQTEGGVRIDRVRLAHRRQHWHNRLVGTIIPLTRGDTQ